MKVFKLGLINEKVSCKVYGLGYEKYYHSSTVIKLYKDSRQVVEEFLSPVVEDYFLLKSRNNENQNFYYCRMLLLIELKLINYI